jgi:hypothetical protein
MRLPEPGVVRSRARSLQSGRSSLSRLPLGPDDLLQQLHEVVGHPAFDVDPVGDPFDRHASSGPGSGHSALSTASGSPGCGAWLTPFTRADEPDGQRRSCGSGRDPGPGGSELAKKSSRSRPLVPRPGRHRPRSGPAANMSCPAGTGVWVVKTLSARTRAMASSGSTPRRTCSATRSVSMNAAWPSLACQAPGSTPRARSTRTPPRRGPTPA